MKVWGGGSFLKRQNLQTLTGVPHVLRNSFGLSWASPDSGNKPLRLGPTFPRTGRALLMGRVGRPWSDTQNSLRNANRMQPTVARFYDVGTHLGLAVFQLKCSFHSDCERACSWALAAVSLQRGTEPVSARPGGSAWALHGNSDPVPCADSHRLGAGLLQLIRSPEL